MFRPGSLARAVRRSDRHWPCQGCLGHWPAPHAYATRRHRCRRRRRRTCTACGDVAPTSGIRAPSRSHKTHRRRWRRRSATRRTDFRTDEHRYRLCASGTTSVRKVMSPPRQLTRNTLTEVMIHSNGRVGARPACGPIRSSH